MGTFGKCLNLQEKMKFSLVDLPGRLFLRRAWNFYQPLSAWFKLVGVDYEKKSATILLCFQV